MKVQTKVQEDVSQPPQEQGGTWHSFEDADSVYISPGKGPEDDIDLWDMEPCIPETYLLPGSLSSQKKAGQGGSLFTWGEVLTPCLLSPDNARSWMDQLPRGGKKCLTPVMS